MITQYIHNFKTVKAISFNNIFEEHILGANAKDVILLPTYPEQNTHPQHIFIHFSNVIHTLQY